MEPRAAVLCPPATPVPTRAGHCPNAVRISGRRLLLLTLEHRHAVIYID